MMEESLEKDKIIADLNTKIRENSMSNKRYEWWKGTSEIIDNKTKEFITLDCPDLLNKQADRISELEEQLKNAIVLPKELQVGNKVYFIDVEEKYIHNGKIYSITKELNYKENGFITWVYCRYNDGLTYTHPIEDYGVELFATKKEAQAKLKELQGESL